MTVIQPDDYFASVEARFESPSPYGRKETTVEAPKHVCECGKAFDTEQGLRVHKGRAHSKMARKPKTDHPWRSPAVMPKDVPDTAPEQKLNPDEEPIPDEPTPDYRMELIETLADLADRELYIAELAHLPARDFSLVYDALARIKAVARDV